MKYSALFVLFTFPLLSHADFGVRFFTCENKEAQVSMSVIPRPDNCSLSITNKGVRTTYEKLKCAGNKKNLTLIATDGKVTDVIVAEIIAGPELIGTVFRSEGGEVTEIPLVCDPNV